MRNEINVGLVGFGLAGRVFHAPVIQSVPNLKLRKVVERHSEHSRQKYPAVQVVRDAVELFADPAIDLVVITTPNDSHFDLARKALLAHKHGVVEKPFNNTSREGKELISLARAQKRLAHAVQHRGRDGRRLTWKRTIHDLVW